MGEYVCIIRTYAFGGSRVCVLCSVFGVRSSFFLCLCHCHVPPFIFNNTKRDLYIFSPKKMNEMMTLGWYCWSFLDIYCALERSLMAVATTEQRSENVKRKNTPTIINHKSYMII